MVKFDQMWLFQHSFPLRSTHFFHRCCQAWVLQRLGPIWYRSSHPDPRKSPQLLIWPRHRSATASQPRVFFIWGIENSQMVQNQEKWGWSTNSKPQSRTATIATTDLCAGALSRWNRTPFISSQNVSSTTFQSHELLIHCGFIWKETMQLVSGKVEFDAC